MEITLIASGSRPWELWFGYWGLSYLLDETILFDTFANYCVLARKLRRSKVDLSKIKAVVLSHDHWDHTGGLWGFLKEHRGMRVYLPPSARESSKRRVADLGGHLLAAHEMKALKENILLPGEMIGSFNGKAIAEQFIVIKAEKGLVVLVGCSHPGIVSIVKRAKELFGAPIYGVIGGLHLMHATTQEVYACAEALKNEGVSLIAPTHCTGRKAELIFKKVFGEGYVPMREGQMVSL